MCLGTITSGHNRVWAQTCVGTIVSGHKHVCAQTCVSTKVSGHKRVSAQSCGHNRVGSSMCGHKRVVSEDNTGKNEKEEAGDVLTIYIILTNTSEMKSTTKNVYGELSR